MTERSIFDLDPDQLDRLLSIGNDTIENQNPKGQEIPTDQAQVRPDGKPDLSERERSKNSTASYATIVEQPGGWIGQYKLLSVLGEGGMGIVYLAQQDQPIKRRVAIKVIKPGMDSKRIIARFEAERQALALLDHPNIAHVHDAGTTESGRPYFVMEYVKGLSITEHCDRHKLTIEERLNLFRQICLAVHHAHQKGIIHRDIKPSNILVSLQDERAIPKIIDFGVAKAIAQPLTEQTLATMDNQLLGTPEYMSPEQADMANEDIDTRSDIYSLGVLLYELLTGVLPFDSDTLREGGIERIRQVIRETDPKTPSTRLLKLGEKAQKVAQSRQTEIASLTKTLHKELEWIPLKAMRKERSERYRSASEFADDIENYIKGAPLIAGPPSSVYRLKKFVARNQALITSITAVMVVLIAGIVASTILAIGQARARAEAQAVADFLSNDLLASVDPARGNSRDVTIRSFLDTASESLDGKFTNEPLVEAFIRNTLGWTYRQLDELKAAEPHLERALQIRQEQLGSEHPLTLESVWRLTWLLMDQRQAEALELLEENLPISRHVLGDEHIATLRLTNALGILYIGLGRYDEAEQLYLKNIPIALRVLGKKNDWSLFMIGNLGTTYEAQGRYEEAERQFLETLRLGDGFWDDESRWTLSYKRMLARLYGKQKRYDEAKRLYLEILPMQRRVLGDEHGITLDSMKGLARVYTHLSHYDEAEKLFTEAMESYQRVQGREHLDTLKCVNDLAVLRMKQKQYEEAESLFHETLEGRKLKLGDGHPDTLESQNDLGVLYKEQGNYDKAESLLLEVVNGRRLKLSDTHPHTLESWKNLIDLYEAWNKPEKAEEWRAKLPKAEAVDE